MPSETEIAEENRRHERELRHLKEDFEEKEKELITAKDKEHVDAEIFVGIAIALEVIATLLVAGEVIGKIAGIVGAIGVGVFSAIIIAYILYESRNDIIQIWKEYKKARDAEDERHEKALKVP
jgi:hypothetical protein